MVGPLIGGWLGASAAVEGGLENYYTAGKIAVALSIISLVINQALPVTYIKSGNIKGFTDTNGPGAISKIVDVFKLVWLVLISKVVTSVANAMCTTVFPLIMKDQVVLISCSKCIFSIYICNLIIVQFSMSEKGLGLIMSAMSGLNTVFNGFLLGIISQLYNFSNCYYLFQMLIDIFQRTNCKSV